MGGTYYSGHGIEYNGVNYIIPVDARLKVDRNIDLETVDVNRVTAALDGARIVRLLILDSCRSNPFIGGMRRTVSSRSLGRGLAPMEPDAGTLVVYAAKHGQEALDGAGDNSPFAEALAKRIQTPNLDVRRLFDLVRDDVMDATDIEQQPFSNGSIMEPGRLLLCTTMMQTHTADRATVRQKKTGQPARFELAEQTCEAADELSKRMR